MSKNRMIKILIFLVVIVCVTGGAVMIKKAFFPKQTEVTPDFVLCYGEVNSTGHIMSDTAYYFADCVKELSGGKVLIEIFPSGQLGDDERCYQAMRMGSLDLYRGNCSSLTSESVPMVSVMALPYLFRNSEHFWKVCDSELGNLLLENVEEGYPGIKGLVFLDEGARSIFTTKQPITKLEDMQGLKIRTQNSDIMIDTMEVLGAEAVPMEYVELYSSLTNHNIDGAENPPISYYYNKFYEVAPHYVSDAHTYSPGIMMISETIWEALGEDYQNVIKEAAHMAQQFNKEEIARAEEEVYQLMEEKGVVITELTDIAKWREAVEPIYETYGAGLEDVIVAIRNTR